MDPAAQENNLTYDHRMGVDVEARRDGSWAVRVGAEGASTDHVVAVPPGYADGVGCSGIAEAELVRASFAFLLEREPAGSILRRFSLDVIPRYFPEYPALIRRYVGAPPSAREGSSSSE